MTHLTGAALSALLGALRELNAGYEAGAEDCLLDVEDLRAAGVLLAELLAKVDTMEKRRTGRISEPPIISAIEKVMAPQVGGGWISGSSRGPLD